MIRDVKVFISYFLLFHRIRDMQYSSDDIGNHSTAIESLNYNLLLSKYVNQNKSIKSAWFRRGRPCLHTEMQINLKSFKKGADGVHIQTPRFDCFH